MSKYVFGVDVGGTTVKMGLFTVEGEVLDKWEIKTRTEDGGKNVLPDIADSIKSKLADKNLADEDIEGVGIGVPGPVKEDGTVLKCVNLGWGILNVQDELRALTGFEVKAGNDANVAALGEMWQGGGKGYSNVVMVTLGTGVGGGIILNGKMLFGVNGAGGEIGHICVDENETEICGCGNTGCLEQYTSATGVVRLATRAMASSDKKSALRDLETVTAKDVFDLAKSGPRSRIPYPSVPYTQTGQNSFPGYSLPQAPAGYGKYNRKRCCLVTGSECWRISDSSGHGTEDRQFCAVQWKSCRFRLPPGSP